MFHWLQRFFGRKPYRVAQTWETPPEIRKKLRCASAGIDPTIVQEPSDSKVYHVAGGPVLRTSPQSQR